MAQLRREGSAFIDVTNSAFNPTPEVAGWPALAMFDYDNDGDIDIYVTSGGGLPNHLYQNDGHGQFTDVAAEAFVTLRYDQSAALGIGDFDNDGWLDMIIGRQVPQGAPEEIGTTRYMKNLGPDENGTVRFGEGTEPTGLGNVRDALSIGVGDIDNDGWLDLYIGRYDLKLASFDMGYYLPDTPNVLLRNTGLFKGVPVFEDITESAGVAGSAIPGTSPSTANIRNRVPTFAVYFTDVNRDGWQDIFSLQEVPGVVDLFMNNGDLTFTPSQVDLLNKRGGWMGITAGDFDRDGHLGYFLANVGADAQGLPGDPLHIINSVFLPDGSPFHRLLEADDAGLLTDIITDIQVTPGPLPPTNGHGGQGLAAYEFGFGCAWFDIENDGWLDLTWTGDIINFDLLGEGALRIDYHGVGRLLHNDGGRSFTDLTAELGFFNWDDNLPLEFGHGKPGRALAAADLNGDGLQDVCRTYFAEQDGLQCLMNPGLAGGNWITVRLASEFSNRFGIGARIEATAGGRHFVDEVVTTTSVFTAVHPQVHFGLGTADSIDTLSVYWPSGTITQITGIAVNQVLNLTEE